MSKARARLRPIRSPTSLVTAYGPSGIGIDVDADRFDVTRSVRSAHDVVRAREDDPLDPGQGRGVKDVRQGIEVRADQVVPGGILVGVGGQVNDRVDPMEVRDPIVVQDLEISRDDLRDRLGSATRSIKTRS